MGIYETFINLTKYGIIRNFAVSKVHDTMTTSEGTIKGVQAANYLHTWIVSSNQEHGCAAGSLCHDYREASTISACDAYTGADRSINAAGGPDAVADLDPAVAVCDGFHDGHDFTR